MAKKIIFSQAQLTELQNLIDKHVCQTSIAKYFNVTDDTIRRICREEGIEIKMPYQCKCIICGDAFYSNIRGAKTCKKEHHRICKVCGKDFIVDRDDIRDTCKGECTNIAKYGVASANSAEIVKKHKKEALIQKYGVENISQVPEVKEKVKQICFEKYGVFNPSSSVDIRKKTRQTNLERYGCEEPLADSEFRAKIDKINIARYGTANTMTVPEIKTKAIQTNLKRYGVANVMQSKEIQDKFKQRSIKGHGYDWPTKDPKVKEKMRQTNLERYGVPWFCMTEHARSYSAISKINKSFKKLLDDLSMESRFEFHIEDKSYDLFVKPNLLIEIDPTATHNSYMSIFKEGQPHDSNYHKIKSELAVSNGYRCIHIFDWDDYSNILQLIVPRKCIYARKCTFMKVDQFTANQFTDTYHIQGSCNGQKENYGLYYDGELVEIMTFGKPRYNRNYRWELLRLCSKSEIQVVGGASKLFKHFIAEHPSESVISYCDLAKFTGKVYEQMGMKLEYKTSPAKIWSKEDRYITDNLLRQRGFDQLFGTDFGKGTSNEELMIAHKWLPVYDCGQAVYSYNK